MVIIIESVNFLISIDRKMMVSHAHKYLDPLQILHHSPCFTRFLDISSCSEMYFIRVRLFKLV